MFNKKLVLCVSLLAGALGLATSASASAPGFYLGGQGGVGYVRYNAPNNTSVNNINAILQPISVTTTTTTTRNTGGLAGRLFVGYQIDPNWGVELGYTQFASQNNKQDITNNGVLGGINQNYGAKSNVKTNAIDFVAKGTLPIENGFSVYGKAGLAYVTAKSSNSVYSSPSTFTGLGTPATTLVATPNQTEHKVLPTASVGVQYDITPQLAADVSYTRIQKVGNTNLIQSTNFLGLGLAYHFS